MCYFFCVNLAAWCRPARAAITDTNLLLGVKLLTTPCSDGGQNYSFFGSNYQLLGPWLFLIWSPRADDEKLCPTPCSIWLITSRGLLHTSEVAMISIQQSDCSSFCPTFSFRIEGAHFAAVFPSCSMLYGMLRSAKDYSHRLCWWLLWSASYTKETKYMAIDRNTNTNIYTKYGIKYKYRYKRIIRLCWWR